MLLAASVCFNLLASVHFDLRCANGSMAISTPDMCLHAKKSGGLKYTMLWRIPVDIETLRRDSRERGNTLFVNVWEQVNLRGV